MLQNIDKYNVSFIRKAVFIHIPKTGGTTIEKLLFNDTGIRDGNRYYSEHLTIDDYHEYFSFYIFTIVRNPYTRIISVYNYFLNNGNGKPHDCNLIQKDTTLDNFLDRYNESVTIHLVRQYDFLKESPHVNYVAKYENYEEEFNKLCYILKYNIIGPIPKYRAMSYQNYTVTPKFIEDVNRIYKKDFETFNYRILSLNEPVSLDNFLNML